MSRYQDIETAPKDGTKINVVWLDDGKLVYGPRRTFWRDGEWKGQWTPTHWEPLERRKGNEE